MTLRNVELVQECFLKHSHMGTARVRQDEETKEGIYIYICQYILLYVLR